MSHAMGNVHTTSKKKEKKEEKKNLEAKVQAL